MNCRHCYTPLKNVFVDLQYSPPCNAMLTGDMLKEPETYYPLKIFVCPSCFLVQVDETKKADEIFNAEYTYFSSYSTSWLKHAKQYVEYMIERFGFDASSMVMEIASNDGYLLQYFKENDVPVLGIDPSANTAAVAIDKGIPTITEFFGKELVGKKLLPESKMADLIIGNNVLAHVPDINDLVGGMKMALKETGIITMEFPHLMNLVRECQFDTIYHEHYSYLSFGTVKTVFEKAGLEMFDVEELPTHGGSLRIFAKHQENRELAISQNVSELLSREEAAGMHTLDYYDGFQDRVDQVKYGLLSFLIEAKNSGKKLIVYGAAGKGNTLLNYCGIKGTDLIQFAVDASPHKQNKYTPGSHIPVKGLDSIAEYQPDYVLILPWNLKTEIMEQLDYIKEWGGKFVTPIPEVKVYEPAIELSA